MIKELRFDDKKINLDMINPLVKDILLKVAIPRSRYAYSIDFIIQAIHTSFAHFAVNARLSYIPSGGNESSAKMSTYYAMSFLGSSKGKDHFTDLLENELFATLTKGFEKRIVDKAVIRNREIRAEMDEWLEYGETSAGTPYGKKEYNKDSEVRFIPTEIDKLGLVFGKGSVEGVAQARYRIRQIDMASPYLRIAEFSSVLSSSDIGDLFTALIELWEKGDMGAKLTKYDLVPNCKNVPILFNAYTDPSKILNDEKMQRSLVNQFSTGMGRRTFVVYPEESDFEERTVPFQRAIPDEIKYSITKPVQLNIAKFFNVPHNINWKKPLQNFSDQAIEYMDNVGIQLRDYERSVRSRVTDGELANIIAMGAKIEKLASIYAFMDGRVEISLDDCKYATYWSSYTSKYLGKISRVLTPTERLYNLLERRYDWVSGMEIEQAGIFEKSFDFNKKLDSTLQNLSQLCSMNNSDLIVSNRDGGTIMKIKHIPLVNLDKLRTSYMIGSHETIKKMESGWKANEFKFNDIHKFLCGDKECAILACELTDGIRRDDNANGNIQFIAIDFDDGITLEDGLKRFENYEYFAYTTRNHMKDKNGKVCDRFRIVLPIERELMLDKHQFKNMYSKIIALIAPEADKSCTNISRMFFNSTNADYYYNDGNLFKAHYFLDENKTEKVYSNRTKLDGSGLKDYFLSEVDIVNTTRTGGINMLSRACFATKDSMGMHSKEEAKAWIKELSKLIFDDYWKHHNLEKEVMGILNKVWDQ